MDPQNMKVNIICTKSLSKIPKIEYPEESPMKKFAQAQLDVSRFHHFFFRNNKPEYSLLNIKVKRKINYKQYKSILRRYMPYHTESIK